MQQDFRESSPLHKNMLVVPCIHDESNDNNKHLRRVVWSLHLNLSSFTHHHIFLCFSGYKGFVVQLLPNVFTLVTQIYQPEDVPTKTKLK